MRFAGGDGGIRTLDRALQPYNGLANRRLQPLGHISALRRDALADMPDAAAYCNTRAEPRPRPGSCGPEFCAPPRRWRGRRFADHERGARFLSRRRSAPAACSTRRQTREVLDALTHSALGPALRSRRRSFPKQSRIASFVATML